MRISSISYFDYTNKIGYLQSINQFTSIEMEYFATALSTETIKVNASPIKFPLEERISEQIRELAISRMESLVEIKKELAINSPRYIKISYADDTEKYFKYDEKYCVVFSLAKENENKELDSVTLEDNPYLIRKDVYAPSVVEEAQKRALTSENVNQSPPLSGIYTPVKTEKKANKKIIWKRVIIALIILLGLMGLDIIVNRNNSGTTYYIDMDGNLQELKPWTLFPKNNDTSSESKPISESKPELTPKSEPVSGAILYGNECYDGSEITVTASSGESYLVKLKTPSGITRLGFYVRAGETVTVGVPAENMYVYFASGDAWYGISDLFGENTSYSMDDEALDFTEYTWEYTLYPVSNGNFSETPIDASEF